MKKVKLHKPYVVVIWHNNKPVKTKRFISYDRANKYCNHIWKIGKDYAFFSIND